jgi:hypothetical protein
MKNRINTGQIRMKTGSHGNRQKKPLSHFCKYGNRIPQIQKQMEQSRKQNRIFFDRFQRYPQGMPSQILRAEKSETLIHITTRIKASNQEKISPR